MGESPSRSEKLHDVMDKLNLLKEAMVAGKISGTEYGDEFARLWKKHAKISIELHLHDPLHTPRQNEEETRGDRENIF